MSVPEWAKVQLDPCTMDDDNTLLYFDSYSSMRASATYTLASHGSSEQKTNCMIEPSPQENDELQELYRLQNKLAAQASDILKDGNNPTKEKLHILQAVISANEAPAAEPLRRGGSSRDGGRPLEVDGTSDSPAPSPIVDREKSKLRGIGREGRGSLPPKDIPIKQENGSVEPGLNPNVEINAKGKITFSLGAEVAFRPKADKGEEKDWIQGVVIKVIGEGKSRRYDVQDPEPDEKTQKPGTVYRTSASSMVSIPPVGHALPDYPVGREVLARYPDTTTFYRAEIVRMNANTVVLRFEGEEDTEATMEVDRRFVLDHRG
jgi:SAGA-associated factor 29